MQGRERFLLSLHSGVVATAALQCLRQTLCWFRRRCRLLSLFDLRFFPSPVPFVSLSTLDEEKSPTCFLQASLELFASRSKTDRNAIRSHSRNEFMFTRCRRRPRIERASLALFALTILRQKSKFYTPTPPPALLKQRFFLLNK